MKGPEVASESLRDLISWELPALGGNEGNSYEVVPGMLIYGPPRHEFLPKLRLETRERNRAINT